MKKYLSDNFEFYSPKKYVVSAWDFKLLELNCQNNMIGHPFDLLFKKIGPLPKKQQLGVIDLTQSFWFSTKSILFKKCPWQFIRWFANLLQLEFGISNIAQYFLWIYPCLFFIEKIFFYWWNRKTFTPPKNTFHLKKKIKYLKNIPVCNWILLILGFLN